MYKKIEYIDIKEATKCNKKIEKGINDTKISINKGYEALQLTINTICKSELQILIRKARKLCSSRRIEICKLVCGGHLKSRNLGLGSPPCSSCLSLMISMSLLFSRTGAGGTLIITISG